LVKSCFQLSSLSQCKLKRDVAVKNELTLTSRRLRTKEFLLIFPNSIHSEAMTTKFQSLSSDKQLVFCINVAKVAFIFVENVLQETSAKLSYAVVLGVAFLQCNKMTFTLSRALEPHPVLSVKLSGAVASCLEGNYDSNSFLERDAIG